MSRGRQAHFDALLQKTSITIMEDAITQSLWASNM
ncbi:hypothetical protein Esi_0118_0033 [Ectocarpus siliculosus]|uniref:Uncharacterized protein n=1 Tax=Ectocarpus siliculosus TaxID=2880 RepID=D7FI76_ECTSI|nr:hypothetical protein Esi_0118_0033 [Ectocarpus siliculosus]|eukprot:CBJ28701.1 hypothetical protein Esi_0118_0033 [Ectocarpus siliculosus]